MDQSNTDNMNKHNLV